MPYIGNVLTSFAVETGNIADQAVTAPKLSATGGTNGQVLGLDAGGNLVWTSDPAGQWVTSGSDIYFDGGNVGIGTTSPTSLLTVDGVGAFGLGSASAPSVSFNGDLNTGIYSPGADQLALATNGTGRLFVNASGQIGVGISPTNTLHVNGTSRFEDYLYGTTASGILYINDNLSIASGKKFYLDNGSNTYVHEVSSDVIAVATSGSERLRITSDGKVGLGTSSPAATLDVNGSTTLRGDVIRSRSTGSTACAIREDYLRIYDNPVSFDDYKISLNKDGSAQFLGAVGIGTTSAGSLLHLLQNDAVGPTITLQNSAQSVYINNWGSTGAGGNRVNRFEINAAAAGYSAAVCAATAIELHVGGANNEKARIDSSGRLLVGTSSSRNVAASVGSRLQIEHQASAGVHGLSVIDVVDSAQIAFGTNNGGSVCASGKLLGRINFVGNDGTNMQNQSAFIEAYADATWGTGDVPGRLVFSTTADGASSPTERMRITKQGFTKHTSTGGVHDANGTYHEFSSASSAIVLFCRNYSASPGGIEVYYDTAVNNTVNRFYQGYDSGGSRFEVRSNGGIANFQSNNVNLSDEREKKNIESLDSTWGCLKNWELKKFHYNEDADTDDLRYGVIAQQVANYCPEVISEWVKQKSEPAKLDDEGNEIEPAKEEILRMGVKEQQMMWMAIKALQEAQLRIETLEAEVAALKAQ